MEHRTRLSCVDCTKPLPPRVPGRTGPSPKRCAPCRQDRDLQLRRERHERSKGGTRVAKTRSVPRGLCVQCGNPTTDRTGPGVADYCAGCKAERAHALAKAARLRRLSQRFAKRSCKCGAEIKKPAYGPWPKDCPACTKVRKRENHRSAYGSLRSDPKSWAEHLAKSTPQQRAWRLANAERVRERDREWRRNNPHRSREIKHRRRARLADSGGPGVHKSDWQRLLRRYGNRCAYCRLSAPLTMDHVVPIARGGRHSIGNVLPACRTCNCSKGDRLLIEWRTRRSLAPVVA